MGLLDRALSVFGRKAGEDAYREGPYNLPITGGWLPAGAPLNWWQTGMTPHGGARSAMVEACVSAYAQTVAMCPGNHWRWTPDGGRERVTGSALTRIIKYPNDYQSISDFLLNAVRHLLEDGNAYALVVRNNRFEPTELHLMSPRASAPQLAVDGSVFYHLGGNPIVEQRINGALLVPARDVLHVRLHTPRHPLVGESPLAAAALQQSASNAALSQQVAFFLNQSRPSYVLGTDNATLTAEQVRQIRTAWNEQSVGLNQGKTPILSHGLKPLPINVTAKDAQLADILKLADQAIADVFRVPLQVVGRSEGSFASTEALMQHWRAGGLGFVLNHIEEAFGLLFKLAGQPEEYLEFDTSALMRSAFKDRVEAWVAGTKGGIFGRNEPRRDFELAPVEGGDEPWVQMQDMPLSAAAEMARNPLAAVSEPALPPPPANDTAERAADYRVAFRKRLRETLDA